MKHIALYMDEAQDKGAVKNDADLAKKLGISRASVSEWRTGKSTPNDEQAVKLAQLIGKDEGELLAECGAARAKSPETRRAWERVAARMASYGITATVLLMPLSQITEVKAETQGFIHLTITVFRTRKAYILQILKIASGAYIGVHSGITICVLHPIQHTGVKSVPH